MIPMKISKDEVNQLPLGHFEGDIYLIEDEKEVAEAIQDLKRYYRIGFDTETRPSFRKGVSYDVSLLQLSTPDKAYLFRLNHIGLPKPVQKILEDPSRVKIGAAVRDDIKALKKLEPTFKQASFFDLNEELKKVGFHNVGVRNLSAMVLNIRISKAEQVSNWEAEELTKKQQLYAATDAWACLEVFEELYSKGYLDPLFSKEPS
ncbi:3'-exoribonuclease [Echinicola pacifica]|uniref:3'-exoribonuclease n=1 Tax=Echinicola pacifica TaxID=346377 RepID=A0A918PKK0_9BACT|nr:3'-5' exonuclease [Echinicola pacifica]GGZ14341.1 3'-exoribonuclease [Echinicola pacifica]